MVLNILVWSAIFIASLAVLIKASDFFTDSAEKIGHILGIPSFIIGVTIVSIGTSLPELVTSIIAASRNASEMVPANIVGSNVANICLILGTGAVLGKKLKIKFNLLSIDVPILIGSALFLSLLMMDGKITRVESILLIGGYIIFFLYTLSKDAKDNQHIDDTKEKEEKAPFSWKPIFILIASAAAIFFGAKYTVESVIKLSEFLKIGKEIIAVSAVALGTSLPELVVTISAVKKKNAEMIVGNVLGSNIFNTFAVGGIPGLISGLVVPETLITVAVPVFIAASLGFWVCVLDKKVTRWEGLILLLFYVFFIGKTFNLM